MLHWNYELSRVKLVKTEPGRIFEASSLDLVAQK